MAEKPTQVGLLLSGGLDSSACLHFYKALGADVTCLTIDYGQMARTEELIAAQRVSAHYKAPLEIYRWVGHTAPLYGNIVGRNSFLLCGALLECRLRFNIIAIGIHSGTAYSDCSAEFVRMTQEMFDLYTGGIVQVGAPFVSWSKAEIWAFALESSVPIELTYSCEAGGESPCGNCISCKDKEGLHAIGKKTKPDS